MNLLVDKLGSERLTMCAEMLRVIAHPQRMEIVRLLHSHGVMNVSGLQEMLDIPQPAVSNHLKSLKDRGILSSEREGTSVSYRLKQPQIIEVINCVESCAQKMPV